MCKYVVAQLGARMHYAVPRILEQSGVLDLLYTDIYASGGISRAGKLLQGLRGTGGVRRLMARTPNGVPSAKIRSFPAFGLWYYMRQRSAHTFQDLIAVHLWAGKAFARRVVRAGMHGGKGVYVFTSAGLEIMQAARQQGLVSVLEQTSAPRSVEMSLWRDECCRFADWETPHVDDSRVEAFIVRERREWQLADRILCASEFVRDNMIRLGADPAKIASVPYGFDSGGCNGRVQSVNSMPDSRRPLRVLTVGGVRLLKGSPYVMDAARQLRGHCEFRMVGPVLVSERARGQLAESVELVGPVPRSEVARHYRWADVFLLPSLCEGSATVTYEALAYGLPVLCTPNTGSVVRDGVEGFIVPPRDVGAIVDRLERIRADPALRAELAANARRRAEEFTLAAYGRRLLAALEIE